VSSNPNQPGPADREFYARVDRYLDEAFRDNPILATEVGVHDYDHELGHISREFMQDQAHKAKKALAELATVRKDQLSPAARVDAEVARIMLESGVRQFEQLRYWEKDPGAAGMAIVAVHLLLIREFAPLHERLERVAARLRALPAFLEESKPNVRVADRVLHEVAVQSGQAAMGFFMGLLPPMAKEVEKEHPQVAKEVMDALQVASGALQDYLAWVKDLPTAEGLYPAGKEAFNDLLQHEHLLPYTTDTLLQRGYDLLALTEQQLAEQANRIDPNRSWQDIIAEMKKDHPTNEELLPAYREAMRKSRQFVIEHDLLTMPPGEELVVEDTPAYLHPVMPYAAYMPPAAFEAQQTGRFWVTPVSAGFTPQQAEERLQGHHRYGIAITSVHEAYPGHHVQLVTANQKGSRIRKLAGSTVTVEGWAFYCEEMMEKQGFLADPRIRLQRLKDQLWRAARIVVDVSLHTRRFSFDEAVNFMVERAHLERENAIAEVRRYCSSPTQPMSYLIGKDEILGIARDYERNGQFRLKEFHDAFLAQGSVPPALIRQALFG